ncbi:unnamed protein product [Ambrosiozyma monospora]|uniref:Unnamed protein product n=1 Tax=Ambrosiozyma monospora TaxID=43982 RepID=A0A9W6YVG3_AMBMO|nr:unnamed protein product [Ambrosiozyma monospora]
MQNGSTIPSYDLKNFSNQIDQLVFEFDDTKNKFKDKRFKFKHIPCPNRDSRKNEESTVVKKQKKPAVEVEKEYMKPTYEELTNIELILTPNDSISKMGLPEVTNVTEISISKSQTTTSRPKITHHLQSSTPIYLRNLQNATVHIPTLLHATSITLEQCSNCTFIINATTFTFISHCKNCVFLGSSQQLRVHDVVDCVLGVSILSKLNRFIIERCHGLIVVRFDGVVVDDFDLVCVSDKDVDDNYRFVEPSVEKTLLENVHDDFKELIKLL